MVLNVTLDIRVNTYSRDLKWRLYKVGGLKWSQFCPIQGTEEIFLTNYNHLKKLRLVTGPRGRPSRWKVQEKYMGHCGGG